MIPFDFPCLKNLLQFPFNQNNIIILLPCLLKGLPQDIIRQKVSTI